MLKIDKRAELAPRDIVARSIHKQIKEQTRRLCLTYGSKISVDIWKSNFPTIYRPVFLKEFHYQMTQFL